MEHNREKVEKLGAKALLFACPTCYCTWNEYYNTSLDLYHSTQFIEKMIDESAVHLGRIDATVTYHDPCDLGRNRGIYDAPRHILNSIPGLKLVEMETNRAKSTCCGGGGNLEMADPSLSGSVAQKKLEEIQRTGADMVVTSCQQCVRTITSRARRQKLDLRVCDITELVLQAMKNSIQ
jgi:heterodisulfide reductase subunit D